MTLRFRDEHVPPLRVKFASQTMSFNKKYRALWALGTRKQLLLMTGAGHRAVLAVAAAAYHRLTLLFLFDHADDDRRDDRDQHRTDDDRADVI